MALRGSSPRSAGYFNRILKIKIPYNMLGNGNTM